MAHYAAARRSVRQARMRCKLDERAPSPESFVYASSNGHVGAITMWFDSSRYNAMQQLDSKIHRVSARNRQRTKHEDSIAENTASCMGRCVRTGPAHQVRPSVDPSLQCGNIRDVYLVNDDGTWVYCGIHQCVGVSYMHYGDLWFLQKQWVSVISGVLIISHRQVSRSPTLSQI